MKQNTLQELAELSVTRRLTEVGNNLLRTDFAIDEMALLGQITLFYAQPNTGKTLLILSFLIESIKAGRISGSDVFYINADDNYNGLFVKGQMANKYNFHMINPHEAKSSPAKIMEMFSKIANEGNLKNKVIVLDTLKKFTDMMSKASLSEFFEELRSLCINGATVIIAGHTNKHLDADGELVYEGTGDTLSDCDCAYAIYKMSDPEAESQVVEFRNIKDRGKVASKVSYQYMKNDSLTYEDMINGVAKLTNQQASTQKQAKQKSDEKEKWKKEITFIEKVLADHPLNQTDIQQQLKLSGDPFKPSRRKVDQALAKFSDELWTKTTGSHNQSIYSLNKT